MTRESGAGLVKATFNGSKKMLRLDIDEQLLVKQEKEMWLISLKIEDFIDEKMGEDFLFLNDVSWTEVNRRFGDIREMVKWETNHMGRISKVMDYERDK